MIDTIAIFTFETLEIQLSTGCLKKRGPYLKMLYLLHLWRNLFKVFCGCSKLIPFCINDVLLSGGAAYRKWRHNIIILYLTSFPVFCNVETAS